jgi:phenylacetate-CoA ligase
MAQRTELHELVGLIPEAYRLSDVYDRLEAAPERLARVKRSRLADLLLHARRSVPAYRGRIAGIRADPYVALREFPLITRSDLQTDLERYLDPNFEPSSAFLTYSSGTSGVPVATVQDYKRLLHSIACGIRWRRNLFEPLGHRVANVTVLSHDTAGEAQLSPQEGLAISDLYNFTGTPADKKTLARLRAFRPVAIRGQPSALLAMSEAMVLAGAAPIERVAAIITGGETLSRAARRTIAAVVGAPVFDSYGLRESGPIASECLLHEGLHINEHMVHVETLSPEGEAVPQGELGEIVVTSLLGRAMPLIRYRTGDEGRLIQERCSCGLPLARLTDIKGRSNAYVLMPDGSRLHARAISSVIDGLPITAYQIRQLSPRRLRISVVPGELDSQVDRVRSRYAGADGINVKSAEGICERLAAELRKRLPADLEIEVVSVTTAQIAGPRGKILSLISDLPGRAG